MAKTLNLESAVAYIENMPAPLLTCVAVLLIGFALKRIKCIRNEWIPLILMATGPAVLLAAKYGYLRFVVEGMVYSGLVWLFHAQIWKRFVAPHLGNGAEGFDTTQIKKTETEKPS